MNQTTHYKLNMPEPRDAVDISKLNSNMQVLDDALFATGVVTGFYTGDNAASRTIDLGFRPKAVLLFSGAGGAGDAQNGDYIAGGLALDGRPLKLSRCELEALTVVQTGFSIAFQQTKDGSALTNSISLGIYRYIAFR